MKKFTFTLQTVNTVREMRQEKEEIVLSQIQAEVDQAAARIAQIEEMQRAAIESYTGKLRMGEAVNVGEIELEANHISSLDRLRREAQANLEQKKVARLRQSEAVAAASREVKVTQKLRETQQTRHRIELSRHEQNQIDEMVSANFARRMSQTK